MALQFGDFSGVMDRDVHRRNRFVSFSLHVRDSPDGRGHRAAIGVNLSAVRSAWAVVLTVFGFVRVDWIIHTVIVRILTLDGDITDPVDRASRIVFILRGVFDSHGVGGASRNLHGRGA